MVNPTDLDSHKELSESRRAEIAYHKKLNIYIALGAAPIFLATGAFYFAIHKYLIANIFILMMINEITGIVLAFRIKAVRNLVRLKLISSTIAYTLLGAAIVVGILSDQLYMTFPWIFLIPFTMLLFFGPRAGFFGAAGFSLVVACMLLCIEWPTLSAFNITTFKINGAAALVAVLIFSLIARNLRERLKNELVNARNRSQAAEQAQRDAHLQLKREVALRLKSEEERAQSEMRYRRMFEESPVAMCEEDWSGLKAYLSGLPLDLAGDLKSCLQCRPDLLKACSDSFRLTAVNRAMLYLYEADTIENLLRNMAQVQPPDAQTNYIERVVSLTREGRHDAVTTARTLRGRDLNLLIRITIPSGFMASWQKVFTSAYDITQKVAMEQFNRRVANQLLRGQRVQAIATLAGGIAHQFSHGLAAIQDNLDQVRLRTEPDDPNGKLLASLEASIDHMGHLTDQLLAYAQGGKYQPKNFRINDIVEKILRAGKVPGSPKVKLRTQLSPDICGCIGDITQIRMVIEAVLTNACEAMPDGGELTISTHHQNISPLNPTAGAMDSDKIAASGIYCLLCIEDTGVGMDADTCQRIFEPFFTTKFFGRGMGMAAAFGIVRNHDGFIRVSSAPLRGTHVSIYLPCHQSPGTP
jgi:signal transduction histidine kinase